MKADNRIEPIVDKWYGHLYYEADKELEGIKGWKYRIYTDPDDITSNYTEFYYEDNKFKQIKINDKL